MSARRVSDKTVELPKNPIYIEFERSDGDASQWPRNTTRIVDKDGEVNYMQPLDLDSAPALKWRMGTAQGIAVATNMSPSKDYILRDWPAGYAFFDHHKGKADSPRHDLYLFGRAGGNKFRSINEFIPHAIWLYQDKTMDPSNCQCKYCQKKSQKEVTASLAPGILRVTHGTPTPTCVRVSRRKAHREAVTRAPREKVYAAVQKAPIPALARSPHVHPKATMLVERNSDLRAVFSKTGMKLRRWYRTGELLWCALNPPIKGPNNIVIEFWPGIVDEVKLKTQPIPRQTESPTRPPLENKNGEDLVIDDAGGPVPWTVRQSYEYRMRLLAVSHTYLIPDDKVLPYQAHVPSNELIEALKAFPVECLNFDREVLSRFNPCPNGTAPKFEDAVAPYAMAVEIGSRLSGYWCLTDEWAFEYHALTTTPPHPSPPASSGAPSLQAAIQAASDSNAQSISTPLSAPSSDRVKYDLHAREHPNVSGPSSDRSSVETQRLAARVLGKVASYPAPGTPPNSQMRFQGLWWGAERIWVDEFVRLKVPRRCIAPKGAENILPPAPAGKHAVEACAKAGTDPSEVGASSRGVFMRLDGLYVVEARQSDGTTRKECRASGMLYELADRDWEEPDASQSAARTDAPSDSENAPAPAFIPAPSPLNPRIPPRPDSAAAIPPTLPTTEESPTPKPLFPSSQLSQPSSSAHYLLPEPPEGFVFRPILTEGHEAVLSLSFISGRYYPRILSHPLLQRTIDTALSNPLEKGGILESNNLWALEGLAAGFYNSVDPVQYKPSRHKMVEDADNAALRDLELHKQERMRELEVDADMEEEEELGYPYAMDIDH
ncbi:putative transcription-silencing protein Clr2 [Lyophyllum shimeji]|uniref:Transcription-silencing protein Clr2 n=1 Tax=Lyophyllum shimeji TaxID=47721 RepID=A0A9P3PVE7_LYOSH|nr:putative transcription-silencing protein Clr2 [Lyophyllum shimeji]